MGPSERMGVFIDGRDGTRAASGHHSAIGGEQFESVTFFREDKGDLPIQDSSAVHAFLWLSEEPFNIDIFVICTQPSCRKNRIELGRFVPSAKAGTSGRHASDRKLGGRNHL